eukprot:TRINITY_DN7870_c0_g1_i1.p1 TRINITY_DN7870_c0_g1~~TRINITY_DN7870_c0_g1_i1.p1  ORF type:complete len:464 (-),score=35.96 TRINITY_DN7870_c0_g1_i1:66-1457(-)
MRFVPTFLFSLLLTFFLSCNSAAVQSSVTPQVAGATSTHQNLPTLSPTLFRRPAQASVTQSGGLPLRVVLAFTGTFLLAVVVTSATICFACSQRRRRLVERDAAIAAGVDTLRSAVRMRVHRGRVSVFVAEAIKPKVDPAATPTGECFDSVTQCAPSPAAEEVLLEPDSEESASGKRKGQWRFYRTDVLGTGTVATVFRGVEYSTSRPVAVKEMSVETRPPRKELQRLTELPLHPNVVPLIATAHPKTACAGEVQTHWYSIIELLPSGNLEWLIRRHGSPNVDELLRIARETLSGLEFLHSQGVVHGDVRPCNILVDGNGRCRLADVGISRIVVCRALEAAASESHKLRSPALIAPPITDPAPNRFLYVAPELVTRRATLPTPKSDVWSYGMTVLWCATGDDPWRHLSVGKAPTTAELITAIPRGHPVPSSVQSMVGAVVSVCLRVDPAQRPTSGAVRGQHFP